MKLPKLAIEGSHRDIRQFVADQAAKSGFKVTACSPESAYEQSQDFSSILIWVTPQAVAPKTVTGGDYMAPTKHDSRSVHANVILFCTESLRERLLQANRLFAEIKAGAISPVFNGQLWRGYAMPATNYDIVLPHYQTRVPA